MMNAAASVLTVDEFLILFFKPKKTSEAAGSAWSARIYERTKKTSGEERVGYVSEGMADGGVGITALIEAFAKAGDVAFATEGSYDRLGQIKAPVLVANGYEDIMVPTVNSFQLSQMLPNAFLLMYPDAGHGFLFQYAERFAKQVSDFLDGW